MTFDRKCPICGDESFAGPRCHHTPERWMQWHQEALDAEFGPGSYVPVLLETDDAYRRRIREEAVKQPLKSGESYEIETAIGYALDAVGGRYGVRRENGNRT